MLIFWFNCNTVFSVYGHSNHKRKKQKINVKTMRVKKNNNTKLTTVEYLRQNG